MNVLGLSCYYHDSAAALTVDGEVVAAAQEERFTRKKHDAGFPSNAVKYCLAEGGIEPGGLDAVAFYDKPLLKFHRLLETYTAVAPRGLRVYLKGLPIWLRQKLWIPAHIEESLQALGFSNAKLHYVEHHESHGASAFYPSPFSEAAVLTIDGVGEWATTTLGVGRDNKLSILKEITFPHSLGLLYSAFTYFTGFRVNSGEYKLMGLAPYGDPVFVDTIREHLIDIKDDGSFRLNLDYFGYLSDVRMTNQKFAELFNGPERTAESDITKREMDLARSIQVITEDIVLKLAASATKATGSRNLCMAGGVALNCVANGRLLASGIVDRLWIQPAAGDAGGALGAALAIYHKHFDKPRATNGSDRMKGSYLGPSFSDRQCREFLDARGYPYEVLGDDQWATVLAQLLTDAKVVGMHQGRMEFGPRSLGNRAILGDPRSKDMQSVMNLKIKYRESFRPFAPSCLEERVSEYFELDEASPYMLLVAPVREERRKPVDPSKQGTDLIQWVNQVRSDVPAITHVDYSARVQTVSKETNPRYHALISAFGDITGVYMLINTSFNVRGEPIVCTPEDAYRCFMRTEMDYLCIGNLLLAKSAQPGWRDTENWRETFALD